MEKKVYLSDGQQNKLKSAFQKGEKVSLQIDKTKAPNFKMRLTETQINQIKNNKRITVSKTQLGGVLPFLIPLLGALATGVASGAAGWGTKKALDKISGSRCTCKKKGQGIYQNWQ